jgi:uncharacterized protein YcfJ
MALAGLAAADETGRVISSTPMVQQVPVTRQVCSAQPVAVGQPRTGGGAAMGAIAGGALGNAVGTGAGRAAATLIGLVGGAVLGDQLEGGGATQMRNVQQCSNQTSYENRNVAWNVVYEYAGQQYAVQMPSDPGPTVRLQVTPVGAIGTQAGSMAAGQPTYAQPAYGQPEIEQQVYAPAVYSQPVYSQPVYVTAPYPAYYGGPYFSPVGISLNLGYSQGYGGHRGHWR